MNQDDPHSQDIFNQLNTDHFETVTHSQQISFNDNIEYGYCCIGKLTKEKIEGLYKIQELLSVINITSFIVYSI